MNETQKQEEENSIKKLFKTSIKELFLTRIFSLQHERHYSSYLRSTGFAKL